MTLPRLIVTGGSGFLGRHLLETLKETHRVFAVSLSTPGRRGAPQSPSISWYQADIGEPSQIGPVFRRIQAEGGADTVVHLAAHYDFTGEESRTYWQTNVQGLRHVLDLSVSLGVKRFVFASSVAACRIPPRGGLLDETSPPDGEHIYARTKGEGERMLREYPGLHPVIVRFAALFSDWCEYPPLYAFLSTWLGRGVSRRILGGRGLSAIPYLHVKDAVAFLRRVLARAGELDPCEVVIASPDGAVAHGELFQTATLAHFGTRKRPLFVPRPLCGPGIAAFDLLGWITGERPFERPWMARYVDTVLGVNAARSRGRLDWAPRPRLEVLRRLPFLIENRKTDPLEWNRRNREAWKDVRLPVNLKLHQLLEAHEQEIIADYDRLLVRAGGPKSYQELSADERGWNHRVVLRHLMNAVRTRENGVLLSYCRDLAARRQAQGFKVEELCGALEALNTTCFRVLMKDPEGHQLRYALLDCVTLPLRLGCDAAQEVYEEREAVVDTERRQEEEVASLRT